jgi:hypothetical protein
VPTGFGYRTSLVFLLIGALLVRLGWVLHLSVDEQGLKLLPDQVEYLELGKNLLHKHSLEFYDARFDQTVRAYRTPGYPLLVALCGANLRAIRIIQALIDTSTILATYLLARRWLSLRACLSAAFIVAVNPFLIYFTGLILSETLFIAMLAWGMALIPTRRIWTLGVVTMTTSILVRPSALLLAPFLSGRSWQFARDGRLPSLPGPLKRLERYLFTVGTLAVIVAAWDARNYLVVRDWTFTTNSGITFYDGFNPHANGSSDQSFVQKMPELRAMTEVQRSRYLQRRASQFVDNDLPAAITLAIKKIARTWSPIPLSTEYGSKRMYVLIAASYSIPLDLLVLWGLWSGSLPRAAKVYLLIPAIYFTLAHALSVGSLRYRIPAEVPMAVIVASGQWPVASKCNRASALATDN